MRDSSILALKIAVTTDQGYLDVKGSKTNIVLNAENFLVEDLIRGHWDFTQKI